MTSSDVKKTRFVGQLQNYIMLLKLGRFNTQAFDSVTTLFGFYIDSLPVIMRRKQAFLMKYRSSHRKCSIKKVFLEISQNSQENTCARVSFLMKFQASGCNFIKRETLAQAFSCEFCQIFKNTSFTEHFRWLLLEIKVIHYLLHSCKEEIVEQQKCYYYRA